MRYIFLFPLFFIHSILFAQDQIYVKQVLSTLSSKDYSGRGYVNDGLQRSSQFIASELSKYHIKSFDSTYFQGFKYPVNTFPNPIRVSLNEKPINPGFEYLIDPASVSCSGTFKTITFDYKVMSNPDRFQQFITSNLRDKFVIIDNDGITDKEILKTFNALAYNTLNAKGVLRIENGNLNWGVATDTLKNTVIAIKREALPKKIKTISIDVQSKFDSNFNTCNVLGYIEGSVQKDSFLVYTAHYDHLGMMGDVMFPGVNDNAGGVAMVLDLMRYYSLPENKPKYSIAFMFFSGEEAGLIGSSFYTEHPKFPLKNIRFLINLDLVSNGDDGITVVNGSVLNDEFAQLKVINNQYNYLKDIAPRGIAANSDHYPFWNSGVKSFFIYARGGKSPYHHPDDNMDHISMYGYDGLFKLLTGFSKEMMK